MSYTKSVIDHIRTAVEDRYLFGSRQLLDHLMVAFLARGHVLLEGPPGTAKTMTAKLMAKLLAKSFNRIQFTTDLLPGDILGAHIFSPPQQQFIFIRGPIFADFIVADEINRTPPRTQSALLEAMEERQVTVEGTTHPLGPDFFVVATQNPQDYEGTFPLPEVQLDRFLFKLVLNHADAATEMGILRKVLLGELPPALDGIPSASIERARIEDEMMKVRLDDAILKYVTGLLEQTRRHPMLVSGSSVRGGIALTRAARILALLEGRDYVIPDDIKGLAVPTLRHRIKLNPEAQVSRVSEEEIIQELVKQVEFPA